MRKKEAVAIIITLLLGTAAGCAPGDVSRYAAQAQQAGKAIFEGEAAPALAEAGSTAALESEDAEPAADSFEDVSEARAEETVQDIAESKDGEIPESSVEAEGETALETSDETEGATVEQGNAETEDEAAENAAHVTESETAANTGTETESKATTGINVTVEIETETDSEAESTAEVQQPQDAELPAMMAKADERVQAAVFEKAEFFSGKLSGRDTFSKAEQEALQAVLQQEPYDDKTLCLMNSARFEGQETESFLLFCDSTALTARGRISGDLWFYAGEKAVKVVKNAEFMRLGPIQCGGGSYLLLQTVKNGTVSAQLYQVKEGRAVPCFTDAVSIEQEADELRVNYKSDHIQYDPVIGKWSGSGAEITYFYLPAADNFEQQEIRALTAEQYLAYIQPDENDDGAKLFKEQQEEKFYNTDEKGKEYRYSFFSIGGERVGYRECVIGLPDENADEIGHAVAEYSYHISKLENGRLTAQSETLSGSGYYFEQWDQRKEELQKLDEIPAMYLKNRIDRAAQTLRAKERAALQCVQEVQQYDAGGLCFVKQADYDGDGAEESFVAVGRYDGAFGAPVCDLWFVTGEEPVLLAENLPVKSAFSYEKGGISLFLLEGYEDEGAKDRLYGVKEQSAQRYLENAAEIEIEENGDLTARIAKTDGELPGYYHIAGGEVTEYGVQEKTPDILLDYDNGKAVYRHLQRLAALQGGELSCLERENGLFHLMVSNQDSVSYETYCVQDGSLVLVDCGDGSYEISAQEAEGTENGDAESQDAEPEDTEGENGR